MKPTKFTFLLLLISFAGFSQNLKKYSGEYPNEYSTKGIATYTYYEDAKTADYIKHGLFKYTMKEGNNYNANFSGNFKNGKRDGIWTYSITRLDDPADNVFYTGSIQMTANYNNGLPNGVWTYSKIMKYRGKVLAIGGYKWTNYEVQPNVSVSANFKNGVTVGSLKIINDLSKYSTITGEFDTNGFLDKAWTLRSDRQEIKMNFNHGIQTSFIDRDFPVGKVYENTVDDEEMSKLKNDFLAKKITTNDLLKKRISIDTISAVKNDLYSFVFTFYSDFFNYKNIEGDDTYEEGKNIRDDGYYFLFKKAELKKLTDIDDYNELENHSNYNLSDFDDAVEKYENLLTRYKLNLSDEDVEIVKKKIEDVKKNKVIAERKSEYKEIENLYTYNKEFAKCVKQSNEFVEKYKAVLTTEETTHVNDIIQKCTKEIQDAAAEEKRAKLYRQKSAIEDSLRSSDYTLSYRYEVGHASETFPIYDKYKSIITQFDTEKKSIKENTSDFDLSPEKLEKYIALLQDCNFIVNYITQSQKTRLESKLDKDLKNAKTIKEMRDLFASYPL